ncbi:SDR family NAD(P)-dependent oxidoreductase [Pseudoclavibacter chungangensis]|uniref:SDR family NAD(P)-dependent oxidoreductase n=1 Tax=Pseudoclavibacter chungangensis TaxID=587635 RepID=UPI0021F0A666|nr:SDR family NAD(P)-dependent oxidoreductase [Pseudoclavibacter chungangensis]
MQAFARQHRPEGQGSIVLLTSGQGLGPMPDEVAYATSKAAIAGITLTLADGRVGR